MGGERGAEKRRGEIQSIERERGKREKEGKRERFFIGGWEGIVFASKL